MPHPLDRPLVEVARALRRREVSATELAEECLARHGRRGARLGAYKHVDGERARAMAGRADDVLAREEAPPLLCGIPVSVKDLYGVAGLPTFAGTARRLPSAWEREGWLVSRVRDQGGVIVGKTHTVELAYGAVGINPHWGTPRNPWDDEVHRIPGGSSSGAGVSLLEGSALIALGSDTGGSIRVPASLTGTVGHKTTKGRWPTHGVVPLSSTLDTLGALTRSVADAAYFFAAVDTRLPRSPGPDGDPDDLVGSVAGAGPPVPRLAVPACGIWDDCQPDVGDALSATLDELSGSRWLLRATRGSLLDEARDLYAGGGIAGVECRAFLERELPEWLDILHPIVGRRIEASADRPPEAYRAALQERRRLEGLAPALFDGADVLALPGALITPPPVADVADMERYVEVNGALLRPTCPANTLGLCALTLPVGLDRAGMPVGLQLVAPGGRDDVLLAVALAAERVLGGASERLGGPPGVPA